MAYLTGRGWVFQLPAVGGGAAPPAAPQRLGCAHRLATSPRRLPLHRSKQISVLGCRRGRLRAVASYAWRPWCGCGVPRWAWWGGSGGGEQGPCGGCCRGSAWVRDIQHPRGPPCRIRHSVVLYTVLHMCTTGILVLQGGVSIYMPMCARAAPCQTRSACAWRVLRGGVCIYRHPSL